MPRPIVSYRSVSSGKRARGRGAAAKDGDGEVARLGIDPLGVLALAVAQLAVTTNAEALIDWLSHRRVPGHAADVALHVESLVFAIFGLLCPAGDSKEQNRHGTQDQRDLEEFLCASCVPQKSKSNPMKAL